MNFLMDINQAYRLCIVWLVIMEKLLLAMAYNQVILTIKYTFKKNKQDYD